MTIQTTNCFLVTNNGLQNEYIQRDEDGVFDELWLVKAAKLPVTQTSNQLILQFRHDPRLLLNQVIEVEGDEFQEGRIVVQSYRLKFQLKLDQDWRSGVDGSVVLASQSENSLINLDVRQQLVENLNKVLFNSRNVDAAELFLLWLTSRVRQRAVDSVVGHISLTLCGNINVEVLKQLLDSLLDYHKYLPLDLETLNSKLFSHYQVGAEEDEMVLGELFIPFDSHLILDETCMQDGKLTSRGVDNMQKLSSLMTCYQVKYPIMSYGDNSTGEITCNLDWSLLVLSGRTASSNSSRSNQGVEELVHNLNLGQRAPVSSLLATSLYVNVDMQQTCELQAISWQAASQYLKCVGSVENYQIPESVSEVIVQDFVQVRKSSGDSNFNEQSLKTVLDVARLRCTSRGFTDLSVEDYIWSKQACLNNME